MENKEENKFEYKRLIKKSLKSHTLISDTFVYFLVKMGYADKYLSSQIRMYHSYHWLKKILKKDINSNQNTSEASIEMNDDYVWFCWLQGIDNAPKIVQDCYESVCYWLENKKIIVITQQNYKQYTDIPHYIIDKWEKGIITNTHFSDILRLELLIRHGGLWLDATTFLTGPLPEYITRENFFVYRNGWMDKEMINMASWLIYNRSEKNMLLLETQRLLYAYWKRYDYLKDYFLLHMIFRIVTDEYNEEWKRVPYVNHLDNHLLMLELEKEYNPQKIKEIKQRTSVHKLTYKFQKMSSNSTADYLNIIYK